MKLAIHYAKGLFSERWVAYCTQNNIPYKIVNCYSNSIVADLQDCTALLWHHHQGNPKDILFAKQLLFALEHAGFKVFPDFKTNWHFDDKVGQKYLFEALDIKEFVQSWVFYSKNEALDWVSKSSFPKVFKLRGGAGSQNVRLVRSAQDARHLIGKAFGKGFQTYNSWGSLKERVRKYRIGKTNLSTVIKGIIRLVIPPPYAQINGREKGYVYFQDFMPDNNSDTRIIIIDGKAFALKRFVRENDFRASGSGNFKYDRSEFDERCVQISFGVAQKISMQCVAFDFVFDQSNQPRIIEISYGFAPEGYDDCPGYWDENLNWYEEKFNPYGWMIDLILEKNRKISRKYV